MGRSVFIIGGTGQIGRALSGRLAQEGWSVTVASRRPAPPEMTQAGIAHVVLDRSRPGALGRALGSGADLLADCVAYDGSDADQLLDVQSSVGAIAAISSASVYCDLAGRTLDEAPRNGFPQMPIPMTEAQPTVAPGPETYSTRKAAMEARLMEAAQVPVGIIRPCAIYGPHAADPREWFFVKRVLDGRRAVPLAYLGRSRFHTVSVENIAALVSAWAGRPQTAALNAVDPTAPTVAEIGRCVADALGASLETVGLPDAGYPPRAGVSPWSVPAPFVLSDAAARAIGYAPMGEYRDLVRSTAQWLATAGAGRDWRKMFPKLAAYPVDLFDYQAEDAVMAGRSA